MGYKMINSSRMNWTKLAEKTNAHCRWEKFIERDPWGGDRGHEDTRKKTGKWKRNEKNVKERKCMKWKKIKEKNAGTS